MSPVNAVYVPQFGSPLGSSQRHKAGLNRSRGRGRDRDRARAGPPSQGRGVKRGKERANVNARGEHSRPVFKVKLPKFNSQILPKKTTKEGERGKRWMSATNETQTVSRGGETASAETDSNPVGEDVFSFSPKPSSKVIPEKEKAKFSVLRTISKMLEENQLIRQRMVPHIQAS